MKVLCYPNPTLKQACEIVDPTSDDSLEELARQMLEQMYTEEGIGLAASQVGVLKRVVVIDLDPKENPSPMVLLNPEVVRSGEETEEFEEGCLSFPGLDILIERPKEVTVEALSLNNKKVSLDATGLFARCLQHEIDHINGVTMLDRATPERRKEALARQRELLSKSQHPQNIM